MVGEIVNPRSGASSRITFVRAGQADLEKVAFSPIAVKRKSEIILAFMSTPDCPWCRRWEGNYKAKFLESQESKLVRFETIKGPNLPAGVTPPDWPIDMKDIAAQVPGRQGVPSFIVVVDRVIVFNGFGYSYWERRVFPLIQHLLKTQQSASE